MSEIEDIEQETMIEESLDSVDDVDTDESVDTVKDIDKGGYKAAYEQLRTELLETQFQLVDTAEFPVILIAAGMEGAGVIDALTRAHAILDSRHVVTFASDAATREESERPRMWRFWRNLPAKGEIGVYAGGWYTEPLTRQILGKAGKKRFEQQLETINHFEAMLAAEGALVLKFWFGLDKKKQKKRLKKLAKSERTSWRIEESLWGGSKHYKQVKRVAKHMMQVTGKDHAPWITVDAENDYRRNLTVGQEILNAIQLRLARVRLVRAVPEVTPAIVDDTERKTSLNSLDLSLALEKDDYKKQLGKYQDRLNDLIWSKKFNKRSLVLVFEGNDAAGKGGAIRRVTEFVDPRRYRVNQYAAPTDEERAHPYLWRFWRRLPRHGHIAIYDRSWYGRVLVERVEDFCPETDWRRAYGEINDFETEMSEAGIIVIKFWLSIDKDEQAQRFKARQETGYKRYKITDEDWRNREKWDEYADAVCDMVDLTSTPEAPWILVEANDKYFARVKVLKTICERIEESI